ncbi:MAG TPA: Pvc16 family protein [Dehalococcoidia bacterium]|nr:Pvc16 family protein [Dehalococcoidia bacterium]
MLNELDLSLRALLIEDLPRVVERIEPDGFDISFDVPNREFRSRLTKPTLSLYLYNIQENPDVRGQPWHNSRSNGSVTTRRPPVRLDCTYMVTAWSNEVEDEHRLLTGAARVLFRHPVLPSSVLQGSLADGIEVTTEVAQPENFKDVVDIWSVLDNDLHPSVRVKVTVPLELDVDYTTPPVRSRDVNMDSPSWRPPSRKPIRWEGRIVRGGQPVVGAVVRVDYSSSTTNARGEYLLRSITPGVKDVFVDYEGVFYQLEATLPGDDPLQLPEPPRPEPASPANGSGEPSGETPRRRSRRRDERSSAEGGG